MRDLWRRLRALWPGLTILAPLPFIVHGVWMAARGEFHWENAAVLAIVLALFPAGPRAKKLLVGAYPLGLVGIMYGAMKPIQDLGLSAARVHLCDLRAHELALFGVEWNGQRVTLHDWFQAHPSPVLDAVCAVPYGTFLFVIVGCAAWLYVRDYPRMVHYAWCYFALNVVGFTTYHLYPAAPPWYYHAHGCVVDMMAHASEGPNLARVDARLGVPFFAGMYGRASDVFGAMPSLHVAYALLVVLEGWAVMRNGLRAASVTFFVLMSFSAVYLDHHWVLDVVAGATYCVIVVAVARLVAPLRAPSGPGHPALSPDAAVAVAEPKTPTVTGDAP